MFVKNLLNFLFPTFCVWCHASGDYLCANCKRELKPHPERCPFCHRVSPHYQTCLDCRVRQKSVAGIMVTFQYTQTIKKLILALKYYHKHDVAGFLATRLWLLLQTNPALQQAMHEQKLFISYVPSHRRRRWFVKGYNQSFLLAQAIAGELGVPCVTVAKKTSFTRSQTKLSRAQRLINLTGSFTLEEDLVLPPDATVLIIDDITTTGATIVTLSDLLKSKLPGLTVWWAVIGRHGN